MINQNWVFGLKGGITFNTGAPVPLSINVMPGVASIETAEGCASVSDANGNLLFYTDGTTVWRGNDGSIVNQHDLKGDYTSTQSCIIVPDPANTDQYYILTMDGNSYNEHKHGTPPVNDISTTYNFAAYRINVVTWHLEELTADLSLPPSTYSNNTYTDANGHTHQLSPAEKITAVRAPNCKDFWILTVEQLLEEGQNGEYVQKNTATGESAGFEVPKLALMRIYQIKQDGTSSGITHIRDVELGAAAMLGDVGVMKCSHDAKTVAIASRDARAVYVYDFDNTTGTLDLSSFRKIDVNPDTNPNIFARPYGLEFSPNSQLLYISTIGSYAWGNIIQVNLSTTTTGHIFKIPKYTQGTLKQPIGALQLGPDNKIYVALPERKELGVINNPNLLGQAADFQPGGINIAGTCMHGLPNLVSHLCPPPDDCDCCCDCCDCCDDCKTCNQEAEEQNKLLNEKTESKGLQGKANADCADEITEDCSRTALSHLEPCFYLYWGEKANESISIPKAEVLSLKICNPFKDIIYKGLKVTKLVLVYESGESVKTEEVEIVPNGFLCYDCLMPCSCLTREIAFITKEKAKEGTYQLQVQYCFESIEFLSDHTNSAVSFPIQIG